MVTVIAFEDEVAERDFLRAVTDATVAALLRLAQSPGALGSAPVVVIRRKKGPDQRLGEDGRAYCSVYSLNREAVAMCCDLGLSLDVIGKADELPDEASYDIQGHYVPSQTQA